jgi:hypothetical protein
MRPPFALFSLLAVALAACSSSSSPGAPVDAGTDAEAIDAGHDSGGFFPPGVDSGVVTPDAGSKCDGLRAAVQSKASAASACDPLATQQCGGTTQGICCPITITNGGNLQAVDDFNAAVAAYKNAGCTMDCTRFPCGTAPSNQCVGTGHDGICN